MNYSTIPTRKKDSYRIIFKIKKSKNGDHNYILMTDNCPV